MVPRDGTLENGGGGGRRYIGQHFGVREAGVIINRGMRVLPADASHARAPIDVDAMPDAANLAQLLDVEVDQFPRPLALVADNGARQLKTRQPIEPAAADP